MNVSERWYSSAELIAAGVFDGPVADEAVVNDAGDDDRDQVEIDNAAGDAWIASIRAEYDVSEEAA